MNESCNYSACDDCPGRLICRCLQVTETELATALAVREIRTIQDIRQHTGAGDGCTACHKTLRKYLERHACRSATAGLVQTV
jgi:bacterioferritin-associated ferredoxin